MSDVNQYEVQISSDGRTIWVHAYSDGSTVGRFGPNGIDIHNSVTDMMNGKGQCLKCTHGKTGPAEWEIFRNHAKDHWNLELSKNLIKFS